MTATKTAPGPTGRSGSYVVRRLRTPIHPVGIDRRQHPTSKEKFAATRANTITRHFASSDHAIGMSDLPFGLVHSRADLNSQTSSSTRQRQLRQLKACAIVERVRACAAALLAKLPTRFRYSCKGRFIETKFLMGRCGGYPSRQKNVRNVK
ncbi:hypothetical protein EVAR_34284_1 [Eumeta japonica]|uniref:Uncharacterized protein n=1 Tax=Eumeta variegata TaxID=151549 RepID=A0A4C1VW23_EUMVA|nr:hypothetical protein EVAR_34284_1 [Eumeta japonica]